MKKTILLEAEKDNELKAINDFFVNLQNKPESIENLKKVVQDKLFNGKSMGLKTKFISSPVENKVKYEIIQETADYDYFISLEFEYPNDGSLSIAFKYVDIILSEPEIIIKNNSKLIYFQTNKIVLVSKGSYDKSEVPFKFTVFYNSDQASFDILINDIK
jgi:hypothetical protein